MTLKDAYFLITSLRNVLHDKRRIIKLILQKSSLYSPFFHSDVTLAILFHPKWVFKLLLDYNPFRDEYFSIASLEIFRIETR